MAFASGEYGQYSRNIDPSIITYNAPRKVEHSKEPDETEHTLVYLRIRPLPNLKTNLFVLKNKEILVAKSGLSKESHSTDLSTDIEYKFSSVFGPDTSQTEIFRSCVETSIKDFIIGKNSAIMAYGISGAGKTHSLLGTNKYPGIIPRALSYLFQCLPKNTSQMILFPTNFGQVIQLTPEEISANLNFKADLFKKHKNITKSSCSSTQNLSGNASLDIEVNSNNSFFLWVSFLEIYNEYVYDLLANNLDIHNSRPKLKIRENEDGVAYVKDLKMIQVKSCSEALMLMKIGQANINYGATQMNTNSSRSHCIFKLTLIQTDGEDATVSTFKFCDLAGSEKANKAKVAGSIMKESQSINASLHVLGRCFKVIRDSQLQNTKKPGIVPYRESKLTKLIHEELMGSAKLSFVVAINPSPAYFNETINTLNFAAIAKEVTTKRDKVNRRSIRISLHMPVSQASSTLWPLPAIADEEDDYESGSDLGEDLYTCLAQENEELRAEVNRLTEELERKEQTIRSDMAKEYRKLMAESEANNRRHWEAKIKTAVDIAVLKTRAEYVVYDEAYSSSDDENDVTTQTSPAGDDEPDRNDVIVLSP